METKRQKHFLFIDESGDHGLVKLDESFPVFVLCGILTAEIDYVEIKEKINSLKQIFWKNKEVVLHSRDIRKCEKEFQILFDLEIKSKFYKLLNSILQNVNYRIIASAIKKRKLHKKIWKINR